MIYLVVGALWIFFSEELLDAFAPDRATVSRWSIYKGWAFIGVTAGLLYLGLRRQLGRSIALTKANRESLDARLKVEGRMSKIAAVIPGVIHSFRSDADGCFRFDFVGGRIEEIYDTHQAELLRDASRVITMIYEEDRARVAAAIEHSRVNLTDFHEEYRIRHPKRGIIWVEVNSSPERGADGSTAWHGILQEITVRHTAEAKVRETAALLNALVEGTPDAVFIKDRNGRYLLFNHAAAEFVGKKVEDVLGRDDREAFNPESAATIMANDRRVLETGQSMTSEENLLSAGVTRTFLAMKAPFRDAAGNIIGTIGISRDITARKQAELAVAESEERLRLAIRAAKLGTWDWDIVNGRIHWSDSVWAFFGREPGSVPLDFALFKDSLHPDDRQRVLQEVEYAVKSDAPYTSEFRVMHPDGKRAWVSSVGRVIRDAGGRPIRMVGVHHDISERKEAAAALRESEQRWQFALEGSDLGVWDWEAQTDRVFYSSRWCTMLGYEHSEIGNRFMEWSSRVHPDDLATAQKLVQQHLNGETPYYESENRMRAKDGNYIWIRARGKVLSRDEEGRPLRVVGTHADISARKEAELAGKRLVAIVESSDDAIIGKDTDGIVVAWNKGAERVFGFTASEMLGNSMQRLIPLDRQHEESYILGKIRDGESVEHFETQRMTKGGQRIFVSVTASPIRDSEGKIIGASKIARNITEAKHAESALRESEARLNLILRATEIGTFELDLEKDECHWNDVEFELLGLRRGDAPERPDTFIGYIHHDDRKAMESAWNEALRTGSYDKEFRVIRADGVERWMVGKGRYLFHEGDAPGGQKKPWRFLGINYDITARKQFEVQFLRAQRMEGIGTLAGGIAHDLNNVFAPIMMSLAVLRMRIPDESTREVLSVIDSSAKHGAEMVRQILSFARGAEGRQIEVQLRHLIPEIEKIANDTFLKSIVVQTEVPTNLWPITGDPTQIHQMLLNLCVNARDAMPNGGTLTLSARNVEPHELRATPAFDAKPIRYIRVAVSDTGIGMTAAVAERIFDPFFTTKAIGKGTGLGLSTTLALVKGHQGLIRVESQVGKGSTFELFFPAIAPAESPSAHAEDSEFPRGDGESILLVDDESSIRKITGSLLESLGYQVFTAADGVEAVQIYAAHGHEIAVVLTDMMMPNMDGPTTVRALRHLNPRVRVIAGSGYLPPAMAADARNLGVEHFIEKPYSAETLLALLRKVITRKE